MVEDWNANGDFDEVVDTLEPVTIRPCGRSDHAEQLNAWRFEEKRSDSTLAPGALLQVVTTWQFGLVEGERPRRPGERICDRAGRTATLRSVRRLQGSTRWVGEAVRYTALADAAEVFEIERPVVSSGQGGATIARWELDQANVAGCFVASEDDPLETTQPREIVLIDAQQVQVGARLHRRRGGVFAASSVTPPAGIGEPWLILAEEIAPGT